MTAHEYISDFLYFVVRPAGKENKDAMVLCCGVNHDRFIPMVKGRYGIGANPISSGLKLVMYDICALALSKGATPKVLHENDCAGIAPTNEVWYTERLLIENAADLSPDDIINIGVRGFVKKIVACSWLKYQAPDKLLAPDELQAYLETLLKTMQLA